IQSQNDFFQMAVHDLRSPLSAMICYSELLMDGVLGGLKGESMAPIKIIHQNCQFLINMVNDLLDSAQLEAGKKKLKLVRANLSNIIKKVMRSLDGLARAKGIAVNSFLKDIPDVFIDPEKMERVYINLLGNAIKFTKPNGRIIIKCFRKGNFIVFSIQDTGPGISEKDLQKIFKKFSIGDDSSITGKGHGLGLAITKSFVEMHGGRIYVKSERHKGSTFIVHLRVEKRLEPLEKGSGKKTVILDLARDFPGLKAIRGVKHTTVKYFDSEKEWLKEFAKINCSCFIINDNHNYRYLGRNVLSFFTNRQSKRTPCFVLVPEIHAEEEMHMMENLNFFIVKKPVSISKLLKRIEAALSRDRRRPL
ncbi:sensor histidine kinase, partial [Fibrobacterota bacterium]